MIRKPLDLHTMTKIRKEFKKEIVSLFGKIAILDEEILKLEKEMIEKKPLYTKAEVLNAVNILADQCHAAAYNSGWWHNLDGTKRNLDPKTPEGRGAIAWPLLLIISEVIEAAEGVRKGLKDDKLPHRDMLEVEMADAIIRIMDLGAGLNMDLAGAIVEKLAYNANREDHKLENRLKEGGKAV